MTRAAISGKRNLREYCGGSTWRDIPGSITPAELRERYQAGGEIAIVDAREEGSFHQRHLLMASCLPLSRLELMAPGLLPRRSAPIVVCDAGGPESGRLAERAAARLIEGGWTDVAVLAGGVEAWANAGYPTYSGVHVPSKAFAEVVEHETARHGSAPRNWPSAKSAARRWRSSTAGPTRNTTRTAFRGRSACPAPNWSIVSRNWCRRPTRLSSSIAAGAPAASSAPNR